MEAGKKHLSGGVVCEATVNKRATIFAKACFGHPSPSKRQKSRGN